MLESTIWEKNMQASKVFIKRRSELHESVGRGEFERLTDFWTVITISCTLLRISCTKIDHSESRNISKTALINPRKSEIGKISKQILDRINTNGRACDLETYFNIQEKTYPYFYIKSSVLLGNIFRNNAFNHVLKHNELLITICDLIVYGDVSPK